MRWPVYRAFWRCMRVRPSPELVAARQAEIARRYRRGARKRSSPRQLAVLRVHELGRLYKARYGDVMPDDDAGRDDMMLVLHHLVGLPQGPRRCAVWLEQWAPWINIGDQRTMIAAAATSSRAWSADQLAWRLGLTMQDRTTLQIGTIGAIDCNKSQRTKLRKAKDRERKRAYRLRLKSASAP